LDLEANHRGLEGETKYNHENGKEYVGITQTPYQNLILHMRVLKIEKKPSRHKPFLPQEVVRCEVWNGGFQRMHNYI
jgi:hypothetical protein